MSNQGLWVTALVIACLLLGGLFTYAAFPRTEVKTVEKVVEKNVTVPVNVTQIQEKIVEVDKFANLVANATKEYKDELKDDDDYLICDSEQFDFDQIIFKSQENLNVNVDSSDDDDTITTVTFDQDLKFSDKDVESKCYRTDEVTVIFHSDKDEDTEVIISD